MNCRMDCSPHRRARHHGNIWERQDRGKQRYGLGPDPNERRKERDSVKRLSRLRREDSDLARAMFITLSRCFLTADINLQVYLLHVNSHSRVHRTAAGVRTCHGAYAAIRLLPWLQNRSGVRRSTARKRASAPDRMCSEELERGF